MLPTAVVLLFSKWTFKAHSFPNAFGIYLRDEVSLMLIFNQLDVSSGSQHAAQLGFPQRDHAWSIQFHSALLLVTAKSCTSVPVVLQPPSESATERFDCMRSGRRAVIS